MALRLFTKPHCEKCDDLKKILDGKAVAYEAKDTKDPEVIEELKPLLVGINNPILHLIILQYGCNAYKKGRFSGKECSNARGRIFLLLLCKLIF